MKLYTEERVMNMILKAFGAKSTTTINDILKQSTPIELPSDEEIEDSMPYNSGGGSYNSIANFHRYEGAKWLKQQILNQNK